MLTHLKTFLLKLLSALLGMTASKVKTTPPWIQLDLPGVSVTPPPQVSPQPPSISQASPPPQSGSPTPPAPSPGPVPASPSTGMATGGVSVAPKLDPLFLDIYAGDNNAPAWGLVFNDARYSGAIIKATEGTYYNGGKWFKDNWKAISPHYTGARTTPWHRGCYHFLKFNQDGDTQAKYYLQAVRDAGGWEQSDLLPIVDVELGGAGDSNQKATAAQVVGVTTAFATRVLKETGRPVTLYGNGAMRDLGITSRMGCEYIWVPRYTSTLPAVTYERAGWTKDRLLFWQYCGDGEAYLPGYPRTSPLGRTDISALVLPGGLGGLDTILKSKPVRN